MRIALLVAGGIAAYKLVDLASALTQAEGQAFLDLFGLPGAIESAILSLFSPCQSLMGA